MKGLWARNRGRIVISAILLIAFLLFMLAPNAAIALLGIIMQFAMMAVMMIVQFAFMFYYLAGRIKADTFLPGDISELSWADYRGNPELVKRAQTYLHLLKGYGEYEAAGGRPIGGLLLEGEPGTGKTWLAKILAAEAGCALLSIDCATLRATFVGIGPLKVSGLFRKARRLALAYGGCVMFLDELDAIGRSRTGMGGQPMTLGLGGGGMFGGGVLTTLLIELDGMRMGRGRMWRLKRKLYRLVGKTPKFERPRLLVIGSTNIASVLDKALTRPGRLGERVVVDLPDHEGARDITDYYLAQIRHANDMDADKLARDVPGRTPAFIAEAVHKSLRVAIEDDRSEACYLDWRHCIAELALGLRQPLPLHDKDKRRLAYHEAGHAVLIHELFQGEHRIALASIVRYGKALGHVSHLPLSWIYTLGRDKMVKAMVVSLGGIAAEEVFLDTRIASAGGDIPNVQTVMFHMARHGMLGPPPPPMAAGQPVFPRKLQEKMDDYYNQLLQESKRLLEASGDKVHRLAAALVERGEMLGEDVEALLEVTT